MTMNVANARLTIAEVIDRVASGREPVVLVRHGKRVAALVSMEDLALLERLQDKADAKAARAALREPGEVPWEQVKKDLGLRGAQQTAGNGKRSAAAAGRKRSRKPAA